MTKRAWIRSLFTRPLRTIRKAPRRVRLRLALEALEDRCCPSTVTVFNASDVVNGDTSSITNLIDTQGADGISLREAVMAANNTAGADTIDFDSTEFSTAKTIALLGQLTLTDTITIMGPGANLLTISGGGASRVFQVDAGVTASLENLTITQGTAENGGGLWNAGTLTLTNCTFSANRASSLSSSSSGGAIYSSADVTVIGCTFNNNSASAAVSSEDVYAYGGAIYSSADVTVTDSVFTGNSVAGRSNDGPTAFGFGHAYGGAIYSGRDVTATNSVFSGNHADGSAYDGSTPGGNRSGYAYGGAVYSARKVTADLCVFSGNYASGIGHSVDVEKGYAYGGAIYSSGDVTANLCILSGNYAAGGQFLSAYQPSYGEGYAYGGAIYSGAAVAATDCTFTANNARGVGRGYLFVFNNFDGDGRGEAAGGAIYCSGPVTAINGLFSANDAIGFGDVFTPGNGASFPRIGFAAGGAVFSSGLVKATNCQFSANSADGNRDNYGGAIYSTGVTGTNCVFTANDAGVGGAIYSHVQVTVIDCTFTANNANASSGGAIFTSYAQVTATHCLFSGNWAGTTGGAITGAGVTVTDCTFTGNYVAASATNNDLGGGASASASGGAISSRNQESVDLVTAINCTFSGNYAKADARAERNATANAQGGAIYGSVVAENCTISGNYVEASGTVTTPNPDRLWRGEGLALGGAISGGATMINCTLSGNYAHGSGAGSQDPAYQGSFYGSSSKGIAQGGAVFGRVSLTNCTFSTNHVSADSAGNWGIELGTGFLITPTSRAQGGAIFGSGTIVNCVFAFNSTTASGPDSSYDAGQVDSQGGAIMRQLQPEFRDVTGPVTLNSCLFFGNSAIVDGPAGPESGADPDYPASAAALNTVTGDPVLGPLNYNGGDTQTMALGAGSAALNTGVVTTLATPGGVTVLPTATAGSLSTGQTYYYQVTAVNTVGETTPSDEVAITLDATTTSTLISWSAVSGPVIGYNIYRSTTSGQEVLIGSVAAGSTQFTDTGSATPGAPPPASNTTSLPTDQRGLPRDTAPDMGAFELRNPEAANPQPPGPVGAQTQPQRVYVVNTTSDLLYAGPGLLSLREAILLANIDQVASIITFDPTTVFATPQTITQTDLLGLTVSPPSGPIVNFYQVTAVTAYGEVASLEVGAVAATAANPVPLTWNPVPGATSYNIYRRTSSTGYGLLTTVNGQTSFTDDGTKTTTATSPSFHAWLELRDTTSLDTIAGPAAGVTIDGGNLGQVFQINPGVQAAILGLTITHANYGANLSGVIINTVGSAVTVTQNAVLTLDQCTITNNQGAGVLINGGTATLTHCTISGNTSASFFAGLRVSGGNATLTDCTISGNTGNTVGGINVGLTGSTTTLLLTNCTISGNRGTGTLGTVATTGGINVLGAGTTVTLVNCTVSNNSGKADGNSVGGIRNGGTVKLLNTIVAGNTGVTTDVAGTFISLGHNLIGNIGTTVGWINAPAPNADLTGIDPLLNPLGNYGGPTQTMALQSGSPAINAGSAAGAPNTDQRGVLRDSQPDIGAFELTVTPVNDAPVVTSAVLTVTEGATVTLSGANFGISDPDDTSFTYTVSAVTGGYFQLAGTQITSFDSDDLANNLVQFVDDGDELAPGFKVQVNDGDDDSNVLDATITYNPGNDAPVVTDASLTVAEGATVTLSAANFGISDPDDTDFTYTVSAVTGGFFQVGGSPAMSFTSAQLAGGQVQFVDDGNEVAPSFSVQVNDGALDSNVLDAAITYTPVNDSPALASNTGASVTEGGAVVITTAMLNENDPDNSGAGLTYTVTAGPANGRLELTTNPGVAITSFTQADIDANLVRYVHNGSETSSGDFSFSLADGGATPATGTFAISVTPANDAPTASGAPAPLAAVLEDAVNPSGATVASLFAALFSDSDAGSSFAGVAIVGTAATAAQGRWQFSTNGGTTWTDIPTGVSDTGAVVLGQAAANMLRFLPAVDFNGAPGLSVRLWDSTSGSPGTGQNLTGNIGGSGAFSADPTIALATTVTAVNDAPSFTKGPDQFVPPGSGPQTIPNWATNISVGPVDEQATQTIVGFTVTNDNNALFSGQPAISATGTLTYTATPGASGVATVTVTLRDSGGTTPGVDTTAPQTFSIRINAPQDAVGVYDRFSATWYLRNTTTPGAPDFAPFAYGWGSSFVNQRGVLVEVPGSTPIVGDWDGNDSSTIGVYDRNTAKWYLRNSNTPGAPDVSVFAYGFNDVDSSGSVVYSIPVVGDWDGDGDDTVGIYNPRTAMWYLNNNNAAGAPSYTPFAYGFPGGIPVVGDWDGNGNDTIGIYNPATATWYLRNSNSAGAPSITPFAYGFGAKPVVGDWDADGDDTIGVWDANTANWYLRNSNNVGRPTLSVFAYGFGSYPLTGDWNFPTPPLHASTPGSGAATTLDDLSLQSTVITALARLDAAGVDAGVRALLAGSRFEIGQLPGAYLGIAFLDEGRVLIDADAAGHGWFVDDTPQDDAEFLAGWASTGRAASGRMDLLSAVLHELGHVAGLDHGAGVMAETLAPGARSLEALDAFFAK